MDCTYDALKMIISWKPKMNEDSIVLFHDINVRQSFGVWKYWEELREKLYNGSAYGHGLGILINGEIIEAIQITRNRQCGESREVY